MFGRIRALHELQSGINIGRLRLMQQFSTMDGWQANQCERFDEYIKGKREKERYEAFDQRVERAYRVVAVAHKTEVVNSFKRKLKASQTRFTAGTMLEIQRAVEERLRWLREVWSQVDADYRSKDQARQQVAAREISAALHGEPGDYMRWVYELKREERFLGPKQRSALKEELAHAELPAVQDEEVDRYHNLKHNMMDIEKNVKLKYGIAGQQHWAALQAAKDELYEEKLEHASKVYKELLQQNDRYEESRRTALLRSHVERMHQAQVRFRSAMELEKEREKLVEAHQAMQEERKRVAKAKRVALLQEAAALKMQGIPSEEIQMQMRQRQLEQHAQHQAEYQLKEQDAIQAKKAKYSQLLEQLKSGVEEREGRELLRMQERASGTRGAEKNVFGFVDEDRLEGNASTALSPAPHSDSGALAGAAAQTDGVRGPPSSSSSLSTRDVLQKAALWEAIVSDTYEDPFRAIHQARMDAVKAYDPLYQKFFPLSLRQGRKYRRQDMGEYAAGNGMDGQLFTQGALVARSMSWGLTPGHVHDLDGDGSKNYFFDGSWHVQDKETGDIDWRYEKKKGGPVFRGPRFYRLGTEYEAGDAGEETMDPSPFEGRPSQPSPGRAMRGSSTANTGKPLPAQRQPSLATTDWRSS